MIMRNSCSQVRLATSANVIVVFILLATCIIISVYNTASSNGGIIVRTNAKWSDNLQDTRDRIEGGSLLDSQVNEQASVPSSLSRYHGLPSYDNKCLSSDGEIEALISKASSYLTAIIMPPKAAGHTMTEFAAQCSDRMSMSDEGNFLNYYTDIKKNLMRGQPINPPKIIASHALNDVAIKKLVQQLPTEALIIYIHRHERDRLVSAIKHVYRVLDRRVGKLEWCNVRHKIHGYHSYSCVTDENTLMTNIKENTNEIWTGDSVILTCDAYDAIEKNAPNMIFMNYKQANKLQVLLAKYNCPNLMESESILMNTRGEKNVTVQVQLQKDPEILVDLDEWIEAKADVISLALNLQRPEGCQGKTREMEKKLSSCPTEFVKA